MLKIFQKSVNGRVVFTLSGRIEAEDLKHLRELLAFETTSQQLALHLKDVTLINQDGVNFLEQCEMDGTELENCPPYIRQWIEQIRTQSRRS